MFLNWHMSILHTKKISLIIFPVSAISHYLIPYLHGIIFG